jgi:NAD-dependent SIR2 family protein deacetylase
MSVKIGTENISGQQARYLNDFRSVPDEIKIRFLMEVLTDDDIISGKEVLHPDWIEIFQSFHDRLRKHMPVSHLKRIADALSQFEQDKEIYKVDPESARLAFLLGAGASKPKPSDIPTVKELLPDLLTRARRLDRPDLQKLADFCDNTRIDNIEDLLTAAQLSEFCSRNPSVFRLVDFLIYRREPDSDERFFRRSRGPSADLSAVAFLQDTLQMLFGLLSSRMLPAQPNPGHSAIATYVRTNPESAIVTTNYDCCMDLALQTNEAAFSYLVDFANKQMHSDKSKAAASLIKLHGSLNWFYCETCQQVHLIDIAKTVKEYLNDENCYSVIAVCKDCGGQRRGLLVPPLAMKFDVAPPLTPLIERAQDSFNKADVIVVVGFSFAEADMYISRMLTKSMQLNSKVRVVVFDPDYGVVQKLRRQLSLRIPKFQEERVIRVSGDCATTLPDFLSGRLKEASKKEHKPVISKSRQKTSAASNADKIPNHGIE